MHNAYSYHLITTLVTFAPLAFATPFADPLPTPAPQFPSAPKGKSRNNPKGGPKNGGGAAILNTLGSFVSGLFETQTPTPSASMSWNQPTLQSGRNQPPQQWQPFPASTAQPWNQNQPWNEVQPWNRPPQQVQTVTVTQTITLTPIECQGQLATWGVNVPGASVGMPPDSSPGPLENLAGIIGTIFAPKKPTPGPATTRTIIGATPSISSGGGMWNQPPKSAAPSPQPPVPKPPISSPSKPTIVTVSLPASARSTPSWSPAPVPVSTPKSSAPVPAPIPAPQSSAPVPAPVPVPASSPAPIPVPVPEPAPSPSKPAWIPPSKPGEGQWGGAQDDNDHDS